MSATVDVAERNVDRRLLRILSFTGRCLPLMSRINFKKIARQRTFSIIEILVSFMR
jgi:hypothetical protein